MTPEQWEKVSELYHSALEIDVAERDAYLETVCDGDPTLRNEVLSLLAADDAAGDFIKEPIVGNSPPNFRSSPTNDLAGKSLGHYEIARSVGSGGMGEVYLAIDTRLGRKVAIKTLPAEIADDPNYLKRFRNEALAAANLNHPNVSIIYSVEEAADTPFITMEYIEGKTLDRCIPEDGLSIDKFVDWFAQIADALAHAHEKGIIHRDIKPGNVMIATEAKPKVLDFGLALIDPRSSVRVESDIHITTPGQIIGTPSYMSPEQAEGKTVDQRTDIFSLGVVMYEALTGDRPFTGDSNAEIVSNLLKSDPLPIQTVRPDVPDALARLIEGCIIKPRDRRVQSMRAISDSLAAMGSYIKTGRSLESFQHRLYREYRPASAVWIPFAAVVVAIAAVGLWYIFSEDKSSAQVSFADFTFRKLSQSNDVVFAHITADGRSVAYNTIEDKEMRAMYIRRIDDRNALQLMPPQPVQYWGGLTTSSDGSQIFFITAERAAKFGTLYRISSLGGQPRKLVDTVNDLGSLSPDGVRVLFVRYTDDGADLISASSEDGTDENVIQSIGAGSLYRDPQFSADGTKIYTIRFDVREGNEYWSIVEIPAGGGPERVIVPSQRPKISELVPLRRSNALIVNATDPISNLPQLYHLSLASGRQTRITNDLNQYFGASADDSGQTIVSAQRQQQNTVWIGDPEDPSTFKMVSPEPNVYMTAHLTPSGQIVYDAVDNNRPHIFKMSADGSNIQQLTPNNSNDSKPWVSPDGRYIVFDSDRSGERRVWRMNIDGSEPTLLTVDEGTASSAHISPDGSMVYYFKNVRGAERQIFQVPIEGGQSTRAAFDSEDYFALSNNGKMIAYTAGDGTQKRPRMHVRTLSDPSSVRVFPVSPIHILNWSRDDRSLFYREREEGENPYATIWQLEIDSGKSKVLFSVAPEHIYGINFSADGRTIVMVRGKMLTDAVLLTRIAPPSGN
jgi:serine/threonine protein kinase